MGIGKSPGLFCKKNHLSVRSPAPASLKDFHQIFTPNKLRARSAQSRLPIPSLMLAPPRPMLAAGCLGAAATFAYWTILRRLLELKRELQEVKQILAPRKAQPTVFLASRERQWPDLSGVWEFDASKADLAAIDIYIRYMGTPAMIRPIFRYAMSRMKVRKARSLAAVFFAGALIARAATPCRALS
jgi:hypothetical protein